MEALPAYECSSRLTAGWLIGVDRRERFRACNSDLLLASEVCYSGSADCFALTCFAYADAEVLTAYLDRYLPRTHLHYDQPAALGALLRLDALLGTHHADRFTEPELGQMRETPRLPQPHPRRTAPLGGPPMRVRQRLVGRSPGGAVHQLSNNGARQRRSTDWIHGPDGASALVWIGCARPM
ncbi:DUF6000 family protein [Streptomyces sp. NPDC056580]|uniref:DUF6000 family protein n=1 Tax=Streptomyces sp. NPDC056580 TaxID=3345872 RepID=UPI00368A66F0